MHPSTARSKTPAPHPPTRTSFIIQLQGVSHLTVAGTSLENSISSKSQLHTLPDALPSSATFSLPDDWPSWLARRTVGLFALTLPLLFGLNPALILTHSPSPPLSLLLFAAVVVVVVVVSSSSSSFGYSWWW